MIPRLGLGRQDKEGIEMNHQAERRVCDQDPIDVLTPEVFALLKLCGGVRAGDVERDSADRAPLDRRSGDRRTSTEGVE